MKNLSNILRRSDITPFERVRVLVHNDVHREKTGKDMLSDSEVYTLTKGWNASTSQVNEYNRYINIIQLESSLKIDAQMFLAKAEVSILRNQRVLDNFIYRTKNSKSISISNLPEDISIQQSIDFLIQNTFLTYDKLLHVFTFNNLPKDIQNDLLLLDQEISHDEKYFDDHVFLYEIFKKGKVLSKEDKELIINKIYSRTYYEGVKRIKNSTAEKDGFLLHTFFGELPIKDLFQKLVDDEHNRKNIDTEALLLSLAEKRAEMMNITIEKLFKEKLSRWLDQGLFTNEYATLFISNRFDTWNGNTKKSHKDLFMAWYTELQKSKQYFQILLDTNKLNKKIIKQGFLGMEKTVEIVTGESLYKCDEDIEFVKDYKKQIDILVPIAKIFLFIEKYATPIKNNKTLYEFKNLAQKVSSVFDIDMTGIYTEFVDLYQEEIILLNLSLTRLIDMTTEYLYTEDSLQYIVNIKEDCFVFDVEGKSEVNVAYICEKYTDEFKKLRIN